MQINMPLGLLEEPAFKRWEVWATWPAVAGGTGGGNQTGSTCPLREGPVRGPPPRGARPARPPPTDYAWGCASPRRARDRAVRGRAR